jgi:hypothetical protein
MKSFETHTVVCATHMHNLLLPLVVKHAMKKLHAVDWRVIDLLASMHAHLHVHDSHAIPLLTYTHFTVIGNSRQDSVSG